MSVTIFFCYAHEDEPFLKKLKAHLRPLQRQGLIAVWHDRDISAGTEWEQEISKHLNEVQIILLLVSPDFMDSDYCYDVEMMRAIERHERGEACVIPIILRPTEWKDAPVGRLQSLPTDAKPVSTWRNRELAFLDIVQGIKKVIEKQGEASDSVIQNQGENDKNPDNNPHSAVRASIFCKIACSGDCHRRALTYLYSIKWPATQVCQKHCGMWE